MRQGATQQESYFVVVTDLTSEDLKRDYLQDGKHNMMFADTANNNDNNNFTTCRKDANVFMRLEQKRLQDLIKVSMTETYK